MTIVRERFTPVDGHWERRVVESFARPGHHDSLGARILHLKPGVCSIGDAYRPALSQQTGFSRRRHERVADAQELRCADAFRFRFRSADGGVRHQPFGAVLCDELVAYGQVIRSGKTISVCRVDVEAIKGGKTTVCALLQQTLMRVDIP